MAAGGDSERDEPPERGAAVSPDRMPEGPERIVDHPGRLAIGAGVGRAR